jgi:hypothetical protein
MLLDEGADDGQAEAGPVVGAAVRRVRLPERLEDPLVRTRGDAAALILDPDEHLVTPALAGDEARRAGR